MRMSPLPTDLVFGSDAKRYAIPKDSGAKGHLARAITSAMCSYGPVWIYPHDSMVWQPSQNVETFKSLLKAYDSTFDTLEGSIYWCGADEEDCVYSLVSLPLFFVWSLGLASGSDPSTQVFFSHDEVMESSSNNPAHRDELGSILRHYSSLS